MEAMFGKITREWCEARWDGKQQKFDEEQRALESDTTLCGRKVGHILVFVCAKVKAQT